MFSDFELLLTLPNIIGVVAALTAVNFCALIFGLRGFAVLVAGVVAVSAVLYL